MVWAVSLATIAAAALLTSLFVLIAMSLDPEQIVTAGVEPFVDAVEAGAWFVGLVIVTAVSLRLWHSQRFRAVSLFLTFAEVVGVAAAAVFVYRDYFT